jgi:hypothetical protein
MLSLEYCRKILGANLAISDEELVTLREQLYSFANLALETRDSTSTSVKPLEVSFELLASSHDDPETLRERAAIIEFEGNVLRDEAERMVVTLSRPNERVN